MVVTTASSPSSLFLFFLPSYTREFHQCVRKGAKASDVFSSRCQVDKVDKSSSTTALSTTATHLPCWVFFSPTSR